MRRLFRCTSSTTPTFIGLTLTRGSTTSDGGAILNDSVLTLNQCTLAGKTANEGGAICDSFSDPGTMGAGPVTRSFPGCCAHCGSSNR